MMEQHAFTPSYFVYPKIGIIDDERCCGEWRASALLDSILLERALIAAQFGGKHPSAKPWKEQGPGILEIVEDYRGDTFRAVYTVRFEEAVYVLHAFQKKSTRGIATSQTDIELISRRLKDAIADHEVRYGKSKE